MIKKLRLDNFRRHAQVELDFDTDAQIVLIAGSNGAGKSTLLEAITYALYGQGRYGRKNLDNLIRRGAEVEGMEVELEFEVANSTYRVTRRRDNGASTATLFTNAKQVAIGADQVTAEISKILGMDAVGFKLATIAQQKELDGLAKLGPSVRAQQIRRLLRLDALTAAADEARATFRRERDIANNLAGAVDFETLTLGLKTAENNLEVAKSALKESQDAMVELEAEIASSSGINELYEQAKLELARVGGAKENAEAEVVRIKTELSMLNIPVAVQAPEKSLEDLTKDAAELERALSQAENAQQNASQRELLLHELKEIVKQQERYTAELNELKELNQAELQAGAEALRKEIAGLESKREESRQKLADAGARLKAAKTQFDNASELSSTCSHCGQSVSEEHRHSEEKFAKLSLQSAKKSLEQLELSDQEIAIALTGAKKALPKQESLEREAAAAATAIERIQASLTELERRHQNYTLQVGRIVVVEVDIDDLYARKAELAISVSAAQQATNQARVREAALTRQADLRDSLDASVKRLEEAEDALKNAKLDEKLEAAYQQRAMLMLEREQEHAMLNHWKTAEAVAARDLQAASSLLKSAEATEAKRLKHQELAVAAANASRLLKDVADRLASQIRPALEGSVSQLLNTLSEGRFASVKIDADYNIKVEDDGKYHSLTEFSGGEMDLIALAMRLALAQVVTERHGAGGSGFLILDEVFGSQDGERREAILSSLRSLKGVYGQILLISHVGGLEDAADLVIDVTRTEDGPSEVKSS